MTGTTRSQTCKEGPIKYRQHQPVSRLVYQLFVSLLVTTWEECLLHDGGNSETEATDCSNNEDAVKAFSVHLHLYIKESIANIAPVTHGKNILIVKNFVFFLT